MKPERKKMSPRDRRERRAKVRMWALVGVLAVLTGVAYAVVLVRALVGTL